MSRLLHERGLQWPSACSQPTKVGGRLRVVCDAAGSNTAETTRARRLSYSIEAKNVSSSFLGELVYRVRLYLVLMLLLLA